MRPAPGFTLAETVVALALGGLLLGLAFTLVQRTYQVERGRGERAGLTATLRVGTGYLRRELEPLGIDSVGGVDIAGLGGGVVLRAQRGLRVTCRLAVDTIVVAADTALDWSARAPVPGRDSLLVYAPGDSAVTLDAWLALPLLSTSAAACPGGAGGVSLGTALDSATLAARRLPQRTVVRLFEVLDVRGYAGTGGWQLGVAGVSGGAVIQPLAGPLVTAGLSLAGFDRLGAPTATPGGVAMLRVALAGLTDRQLAAGLGGRSIATVDSAITTITLRNVP
jgi:hypothetical protein